MKKNSDNTVSVVEETLTIKTGTNQAGTLTDKKYSLKQGSLSFLTNIPLHESVEGWKIVRHARDMRIMAAKMRTTDADGGPRATPITMTLRFGSHMHFQIKRPKECEEITYHTCDLDLDKINWDLDHRHHTSLLHHFAKNGGLISSALDYYDAEATAIHSHINDDNSPKLYPSLPDDKDYNPFHQAQSLQVVFPGISIVGSMANSPTPYFLLQPVLTKDSVLFLPIMKNHYGYPGFLLTDIHGIFSVKKEHCPYQIYEQAIPFEKIGPYNTLDLGDTMNPVYRRRSYYEEVDGKVLPNYSIDDLFYGNFNKDSLKTELATEIVEKSNDGN